MEKTSVYNTRATQGQPVDAYFKLEMGDPHHGIVT